MRNGLSYLFGILLKSAANCIHHFVIAYSKVLKVVGFSKAQFLFEIAVFDFLEISPKLIQGTGDPVRNKDADEKRKVYEHELHQDEQPE
jgi:hypothetical protein